MESTTIDQDDDHVIEEMQLAKQPKFTGLFKDAIEFALKAHEWQVRKSSNMPYLWHPMRVAMNVEKYKKSTQLELLMTVALLHDVVEDNKAITVQQIADLFGYKVASIVEELTNDPIELKRLGKTEYLKQKMTHLSSYALVIKLSDRLDNVKDLPSMPIDFQMRYAKETIAILDHLQSWVRKLSNTHQILIDKIRSKLCIQ